MEKSVIYVVSDSVGETAELVTKAAVSQFNGSNIVLKRYPYVEDKEHIDEVISLAVFEKGMIVFTLVKPDMREYMTNKSTQAGIYAYDLMGPLLDKIEAVFDKKPLFEPGLVRKLDEEYFRKIEAIEFAVKYDDGRDPRGILRADIVLLGVSRTSKTPLSQYLAHQSVKVANVPLVPEVELPEELYQVPKEKLFGLKISPEKLNDIRKERLKSLGLADNATYANIDRITEEMKYFEQVSAKVGCHIIDVTNKAVEETANIILDIYFNK